MSIMFLFCLIAVIVETGFFWTLGMNHLMIPNGYRSIPTVVAAELVLIAVEFSVYSIAFGRSWKLLLLTIAANALSFGALLVL